MKDQSRKMSISLNYDKVKEDADSYGGHEGSEDQFQIASGTVYSMANSLRIALSAPELQQLKKALSGDAANATHIIQGYIGSGLVARGHNLTYVMPRKYGGPLLNSLRLASASTFRCAYRITFG